MAIIIFVLGIVLFVFAGIHQIAWLGLTGMFASIAAMLLGGKPAARWVRVRTLVKRPSQRHHPHSTHVREHSFTYRIWRLTREEVRPRHD